MSYNAGLGTLKRFHVSQMESNIGEHFNPDKHDVIFQVPSPNSESGLIMHEVQRGYYIQERVLRSAKVGVSKK